MDTFRELCTELLELNYDGVYDKIDWSRRWDEFIARVHTALDKPEPEELTDQKLWNIGERHLLGADGYGSGRLLGTFIPAARAVIAADRSRHHHPSENTVLDPSKSKDLQGEEEPKFLEENLAAFNPFRYPTLD